LKRPRRDATDEEIIAYRRRIAATLEEIAVDYGEEFVILPAADLANGTIYELDAHDQTKLGGFRSGSDSARKAAIDNYPRSGSQRHRVLVALVEAGERGVTSDEIHASTGMNLYSVKPRLIELREGGWAEQNGKTRPSPRGSATDVYVATERGKAAVREKERQLVG
jgi:hypothetical protein